MGNFAKRVKIAETGQVSAIAVVDETFFGTLRLVGSATPDVHYVSAHAPIRLEEKAMGRGFWLSLGVSVTLHGAVGGMLAALFSRTHSLAEAPLAVASCVIIDDEADEEFLEPEPAFEPIVIHAPQSGHRGNQPEHNQLISGSESTEEVRDTGTSGGTADSTSADQTGSRFGAPGGSKNVSFFNLATDAQSVVFVIDRSSSMAHDGALDSAKRELRKSLERLPETAIFQVLVYNRRVETCPEVGVPLQRANASVVEAVNRFVEELLPEGSTDHMLALQRALSLEPEVIFFLTDSDDLDVNQVHRITQLNRGRAVIHTLELLPTQFREDAALVQLARLNRGRHVCVQGPGSAGN